MDLQLKDKVVIVTGGSAGIGAAITEAFYQEGARMVIASRNQKMNDSLRVKLDRLKTHEGNDKEKQALFIEAELSREEDCRKVIDTTLKIYKKIDVLINNAGVNDGVGLESNPSAFMQSLQKNIFHFFALAHYALDALKKSQGNIINIGSKVADTGQGNTSGYAAAKGACNALTREWALDLARHHIRVNAVIPAEVMTPLYQRWLNSLEHKEIVQKQIEELIPFQQRFTLAEEIAAMTVFLASSTKSAHTTGQIIYVDGGYTHLDRAYTQMKKI